MVKQTGLNIVLCCEIMIINEATTAAAEFNQNVHHMEQMRVTHIPSMNNYEKKKKI